MQIASVRERVAASFAAIIMLAMIPLPFLVELLGAALVIWACSRYDLSYAGQHTLRMLDLTITFFVLGYVVLGLLKSAIQIVASDAGLPAPPAGVSIALYGVKVLLTIGYLLIMLGYLVCALLGRELKLGVSMGMIEALRGRRPCGESVVR